MLERMHAVGAHEHGRLLLLFVEAVAGALEGLLEHFG